MAITHSTAARNAAADAVVDLIDAGATDANGDLVLIASAGPTDLATLAMSNPAFGAAASGVASANAISDDTNAAGGGDADSFEIRDLDNATVISGTVTATGGGGDIELDNVTINNGDTVTMSTTSPTFDYTAPT